MMSPLAKVGFVVALASGAMWFAGVWQGSPVKEAVALVPRVAVPETPAASRNKASASPASDAASIAAFGSRASAAQEVFATAVMYAECEQRTLNQSVVSNDLSETYQADPSGGLAARLQREAERRDARCRPIGLSDFRRIDLLLQQAAAQGSVDARSLQWRRRLDALLSRLQPGDGAPEAVAQLAPVDAAELQAINSGLEALALMGHADSINALQQLLSSGVLPVSDPVHAAAWRLVSYQAVGKEMPLEEPIPGRAEVLDDLDDAARDKVLAQARSLFNICCRQ